MFVYDFFSIPSIILITLEKRFLDLNVHFHLGTLKLRLTGARASDLIDLKYGLGFEIWKSSPHNCICSKSLKPLLQSNSVLSLLPFPKHLLCALPPLPVQFLYSRSNQSDLRDRHTASCSYLGGINSRYLHDNCLALDIPRNSISVFFKCTFLKKSIPIVETQGFQCLVNPSYDCMLNQFEYF